MSSHRLAIDSGRWVKPIRLPLEERKCTDCNVLEDEYHFIFECNRYTELRKKYIYLNVIGIDHQCLNL